MRHVDRAKPARRRSTIIGVVLASAIALIAGGCGAGQSGAEDDALVVLVEGGGHTALPPIAEKFEEATGVKVSFVELPYESMYDRINSDLASGSPTFDITAIGGELLPAFWSQLAPLDELFTAEVRDDNFPALIEEATFDGHPVAMPIWTNAEILYYRTDLFGDPEMKAEFLKEYGYELVPPSDWESFRDAAKFFTRDLDGDGKIDLYGTDVKGAEEAEWLATVLQAGASSPVFGSAGEVIVNDAAHLAALDFYAGLAANDNVSPPGAAQIGWAEAQNLYNQGQTAMTRFWAHAYAQIPADSPASGNTGLSPMPAGPAGYAAIPGAYYLAIPAKSGKPDLARQFAQYAFEHNELLLDTPLALAARVSALEGKKGAAGHENIEPLIASLAADATQPRPAVPQWRQIVEEALLPMLQKAVVDSSNNQALLDEAKTKIEAIVKQ